MTDEATASAPAGKCSESDLLGATSSKAELKRSTGRSGFFSLAFGAVVGSGWVVVLGGWLGTAGPGGAAIGFLLGGLVMVLVSLCYGELVSRFSKAGGEFLYTFHTFGRLPAFLVGWFITFYMIAVCAFEGIALAWFVRLLIPAIELPVAYTISGTAVTWDAIIVGFATAVGVAALHLCGAKSVLRYQNAVTFGFIIVSILLITYGFSTGDVQNIKPLFPQNADHSVIVGVLAIFSTTAFFLNGWQASLHAIEERAEGITARAAIYSMVTGVAVSTAFYVLIILSASMAMPWEALLKHEMPGATAFGAREGAHILTNVVLVAAIASLTKTWSAVAWAGSRLMFAQARYGLLPGWFARVDPRVGAPKPAILVVTVVSMIGMALGRSAITPIVDALAICSALSIILCLVILLRRRRIDLTPASFSVPGGLIMIWTAMLGALAMVGVAVFKPFLESNGELPTEWILLSAWGLLGGVVWFATRRLRENGQHRARELEG